MALLSTLKLKHLKFISEKAKNINGTPQLVFYPVGYLTHLATLPK